MNGSCKVNTEDETARELCPSYRPELPGARAFAVVVGTPAQPEVAFMRRSMPVTDELLRRTGDVDPTEVFRFAGPCSRHGCRHYQASSGNCQLVRRSVQLLDSDARRAPPCAIRNACKWWRQEGKAACLRCPRIVSSHAVPSERFVAAARPVAGPNGDNGVAQA